MAMKDRNDNPLNEEDQVRYFGQTTRDVAHGDTGTVKSESSNLTIMVDFGGGGAGIPINRFYLEKI